MHETQRFANLQSSLHCVMRLQVETLCAPQRWKFKDKWIFHHSKTFHNVRMAESLKSIALILEVLSLCCCFHSYLIASGICKEHHRSKSPLSEAFLFFPSNLGNKKGKFRTFSKQKKKVKLPRSPQWWDQFQWRLHSLEREEKNNHHHQPPMMEEHLEEIQLLLGPFVQEWEKKVLAKPSFVPFWKQMERGSIPIESSKASPVWWNELPQQQAHLFHQGTPKCLRIVNSCCVGSRFVGSWWFWSFEGLKGFFFPLFKRWRL